MSDEVFYRINKRVLGRARAISVTSKRGTVEATSAERVVPPILVYDNNGLVSAEGLKAVLSKVHKHPYKPNSPEFPAERLADLEAANLMSHLENFPQIPTLQTKDGDFPHPIAEHLYSNQVYLKPTLETDKSLKKLSFLDRGKALAKILEKVRGDVLEKYGIYLDFYSVPKKDIGRFVYLADPDGYGIPVKTFSLGFHKAIPPDRVARELSSLKSAEMFINPVDLPYDIPENIRPFFSGLKVAVILTKESMLDSGDLYPSGLPKIASVLIRTRIERDLEKIPKKDRNIVYANFRSGINLEHHSREEVDETIQVPGTVRLIFPGGVKIAAQMQETQMESSEGPVDLAMDLRTFANKGAIATLAMMNFWNPSEPPTLEECIERFESMSLQDVWVGGTRYKAFVGDLPCLRPGQRYTELSRGTNRVSVDLIAKAIAEKPYRVSKTTEEEYSRLRTLHREIRNSLLKG